MFYFSKNINIICSLILFFSIKESLAEEYTTDKFTSNSYAIIVNSENLYKNSQDKGFRKIKLLYFKNSKEWPGKVVATFLARNNGNLVEEVFYNKVLGMNADEVNDFWSRSEQSSSLRKPKLYSNVREIVQGVAKDKGAYSIVNLEELPKIPAKIRILYKFELAKR